MSWGWELIVDAYDANHSDITNHQQVYNFAKELVKRIDMVAYGEPLIYNFGSEDKAGYTLVQLIETSNISAHFSNETNNIYLNVFSCKPFKECDVLDVVKEYFDPKRMTTRMVQRGNYDA